MLSENFDKKIIDAVEERTADFDEASWQKMEKLLDKHLPQKKDDRRRFILLLFFFILLGGGTVLWLTGVFSSKEKNIASIPVQHTDVPETENNSILKTDQVNSNSNQDNQEKQDITFKIDKISASKRNLILPEEKLSIKTSPVLSHVSVNKQTIKKIKTAAEKNTNRQKNEIPAITDPATNNQTNKKQTAGFVEKSA